MSDDNLAEQDQHQTRIGDALDRLVDNLASYLVALDADADPTVLEHWTDVTYNELRDALDPEDRLCALLMVLRGEAQDRADRLVAQFRTDTPARSNP